MKIAREKLGSFWNWLKTLVSGQPHFIVGTKENPYLHRWYLIPRNRWLNIYLHQFLRDDDDRALHDHPWRSLSILLRGRYLEITPDGQREFRAGNIIWRNAEYRHRLLISPYGNRPAWTLFLTGRKVRTWGFWCPQGFVPWNKFVVPSKPGQVGRGCGD